MSSCGVVRFEMLHIAYMDTDPFLISYQPRELGVGRFDAELGDVFSSLNAVVFRHWRGPESAYMAVSRLVLPVDVDRLTSRVELKGIARLVLDEDVQVVGERPAIEAVLRPDPTSDLWLPSFDIHAGAEIQVCPLCGGMNRHFNPPPH
jgi:hypothetical protein